MKVFLMYPDRDFDPEQKFPLNEQDLVRDLALDVLLNAMAHGDKFLLEVARQALLAGVDTPDVIRYRQDVLRDCLENPAVVREIYRIPTEAIEIKQREWMGIFSHYPSGILNGALKMLEMFVEQLKKLRRIADEHAADFKSEGFTRFFTMIKYELNDDYFAVVENHIKTLKFPGGVVLSARLGKGNEGTNYVLRKPIQPGGPWFKRVFTHKSPSYSFRLHPRDEQGARALEELKDRGLNLVANAVAQSTDHIKSFFNILRQELAFYLGCLNLSEQLAQLQEPICFPQPVSADERQLSFTNLYDVSLALTTKKTVVGNDVNADNKDLILITGANQGGKSTFLRSIGLAQLMMQAGMFVPAESFHANVCRGLFTHYKREEDTAMESGKFEEELVRMNAIMEAVQPNALILFNESFAATNEREGSEIARQIVTALLEKHIKVAFVTHLYTFANSFYKEKMENVISLRAERQPDGTRTFKLKEAEPLQTSYGMDVYNNLFKEDVVYKQPARVESEK